MYLPIELWNFIGMKCRIRDAITLQRSFKGIDVKIIASYKIQKKWKMLYSTRSKNPEPGDRVLVSLGQSKVYSSIMNSQIQFRFQRRIYVPPRKFIAIYICKNTVEPLGLIHFPTKIWISEDSMVIRI